MNRNMMELGIWGLFVMIQLVATSVVFCHDAPLAQLFCLVGLLIVIFMAIEDCRKIYERIKTS